MVKRSTTALISRKYQLHLPAMALAAALAVIVFSPGSGSRAAVLVVADQLAPAPPWAVAAVTRSAGGVDISWQKSQPGAYPVTGYVVSKSVNGQFFRDIARTTAHRYTDPDGRAGDTYQVAAFDDQTQPHQSAASDSAPAKLPAASLQAELALAPSDLKTVEKPTDKLAALKAASLTAPDSVIATLLGQYSHGKEKLISRLDQLNPAQRAQAAQDCARQESTLETLTSSVGEDLQLKLIEALARCQLLK